MSTVSVLTTNPVINAYVARSCLTYPSIGLTTQANMRYAYSLNTVLTVSIPSRVSLAPSRSSWAADVKAGSGGSGGQIEADEFPTVYGHLQ